ncbi:MAG: tetratricopeptide repeat protein [Saprospiraceae bacterium]
MRYLFMLSSLIIIASVQSQNSVTSLSGSILKPPTEAPEVRAKKDKELAEAEKNFLDHPKDMESLIWYGRRMAYTWEYDKAIQLFTYGISLDPDNPELYRHRGHRFITTRQFDRAIDDLETAARLAEGKPLTTEPDGQPNAKNIPLSNLHFNIYYHLGLAYYLTRNYAKAEEAYRKCLGYSNNDDLLCATTDWLYMTLCRQGKMQNASSLLEPITKEMNIIENESYHKRLLMYKGEMKPEELFGNTQQEDTLNLITQGYGVANFYYCTGKKEQALNILKRIVQLDNWAAFGFIAAEADLVNGL